MTDKSMTDIDLARLRRAVDRPLLYVAGPMTTSGNPYDNVRVGALAGQRAFDLGWAPFVPHLSAISAMITGRHDWDEALEYDYAVLRRCDAMLLLPGASRGAEAEERLALHEGIWIFHGLVDLPSAQSFLDGTWEVQ